MLTGYCPVLCSLCVHAELSGRTKSGRSSITSVPDLKDSLLFNSPGRILYLRPPVCAVGDGASSQINSGNISVLPIESFGYISRDFEHQSYVGLYNRKNKTLGKRAFLSKNFSLCKVIKARLSGRFIRVHSGGKNASAEVIISHKEIVFILVKVITKPSVFGCFFENFC